MTKLMVLDKQRSETRTIIENLLEDGSNPDAMYIIEHHLSSSSFDLLETIAIKAFKLGYEISDVEEIDVEDGITVFCCDLIAESPLDEDLINAQVSQVLGLLTRHEEVYYDGWGTYFEDDEESEFTITLENNAHQEEVHYH